MACVHCRHRKIRCDGAQPSCYTCTRLQRKCEYERVSEQDNLLSRERKRLSRERKAARLAASANQSGNARSADDKSHASIPPVPMASTKAPTSAPASFAVPMPGMGITTTPTEVTPALIQAPPNDAAMAAATWANIPATINPSTKDLMPWVMPSAYTTPDAASLATVTMPPAHDALLSLRTTTDPSLLDLGSAPVLSDASASASASASPGTGWADSMSLSPSESPFGSDGAGALSSLSGGSLPSEATLGDPLELNTSMDTPLKLFSDQQMSSASSATPSSIDTQGLSDGSSSLGTAGSMVSPLSPQLAPPSFDTMEPGVLGPFDGGCDGLAAGMGLYSASLPASSGASLLGDPVPSSLPILSSWTHPMAGF